MRKYALKKCGELRCLDDSLPPKQEKGYLRLPVHCCAICRTDAKMWKQGHRDLVLPRVLGHEIITLDKTTGQLAVVWPGEVCGECEYCLAGRENLCEKIQIIGFHSDGGFAEYVRVPRGSVLPVEESVHPHALTFAEPVACVLNGVARIMLADMERVIIYGGGVLGMVAALVFRERNCSVTVVEKSQRKIERLRGLCEKNTIELCKDTVEADFDIGVNCCDSDIAFSLCISKLKKGGRCIFFSGLQKNRELETNLLNLIHYKELELYGSYGPAIIHMRQAVAFCIRQQNNLLGLIEKSISPEEIETVLEHILSGEALKYIVDFKRAETESSAISNYQRSRDDLKRENSRTAVLQLPPFLSEIVAGIKPVSEDIRNRAWKKVDLKTKPLGALGRIEDLAVRMSLVQNCMDPEIDCKRMFVFAGDHGVCEEGVSVFPAKVTVQMVENFLAGGAAINVFCKRYGIELAVVDMGVNGDFDDHDMLLKKKIAKGTRNFTVQGAMSFEDAVKSVVEGARVFQKKNRKVRCHLAGMGEMGIGNSSSAVAIICGVTGLSVGEVVGRGTGVDDRGLARKIEVIERALNLHNPRRDNALQILADVGGFELGGICGATLAAASEGCCVVLDGIISTAAGLLAYLICPEIKEYLIAGHKSVEKGQLAALEIMGLEPVLDLDMRLGEGTGAALTMNLVELACNMMCDMASFDDAGVDSSL